ncbi:hypothetical protein [Burkholderia cenocepacia]|uniref:hypothetical protein n=1 Tax=Burkholderia cenocepacia TaxID=95486 RepID=UPI001BA5A116|nr:hypothetical protein [Burkholderia cenocepacia]QUN57092.1 hypothetical protein KEH58_18160 [Burkholderia cenocepacia]
MASSIRQCRGSRPASAGTPLKCFSANAIRASANVLAFMTFLFSRGLENTAVTIHALAARLISSGRSACCRARLA